MVRITFLLFLLAISACTGLSIAQDSRIDSLKKVIAAKPDSLSLPFLDSLADEFNQIQAWDSVKFYNDIGYPLALTYKDSTNLLQFLYNYSPYYKSLGDSITADSFSQAAYYIKGLIGSPLNKEFDRINNSIRSTKIQNGLLIYEDSSKSVDFDSAQALFRAGKFKANRNITPSEDVYTWIRFRIQGYPDSSIRALFMVGMEAVSWDSVEVYLPIGNGNYSKELTGLKVKKEDKNGIKDWRNLFYVNLPAGSDTTIWLKLYTARMEVPPESYYISQLEADYLENYQARTERYLYIFLGILMAMGMYFLLLAITTKEESYIPYLIYLSGVILFSVNALKYHEWIMEYPTYDWFVYILAIGVAGLGLLTFAKKYLNIKELSPRWHRISNIFVVLFIIPPIYLTLAIIGEFLYEAAFQQDLENNFLASSTNIMGLSLFIMISLGLILTLVLGIIAYRKGFKPASSYLIAMSFLILMVGLTPLLLLIAPLYTLARISLAEIALIAEAGIVLQLIFFALGVGQKINLLEKDNAKVLKERLEIEKDSNQKLLQADKLKDEFLANTSHELRTPLNGILGLSEAVHDGITGPTTPEMRENLAMVISSARRLSGLVNDLLDFSRLRNYDLDLQLRPLDFNSLADVVMRVSMSLLGGKRINLHQELKDDLPPIMADENRLQQILYNLLGNAIKFTEEGNVILKAEEKADHLLISVVDTGIGIPEDKQERIFQSFEQGDGSTARKYGGTGLGLSITRQLVELHGGEIGLESEPGKGSTFWFTLPLAKEGDNYPPKTNAPYTPSEGILSGVQVPQAKEAAEISEPHTSLQNYPEDAIYRILVVDDEPVNRQVLKNHLSTEPYYVTTVMNGVEALEAIESGQEFDLVLLDVMMPKLSGFEVCQRLREKYLPSELPIIMITAKNQVSDLVSGLTFGANDYIVKPFSKQELLARIQTHLNLLDIHAATSRFVPFEFLKSLGKDTITDVKLGDQVAREGTVLFSDIRGYTSLAEGMTPQQTFAFLNAYLGRMGPVIQSHRGFVNQFYGDGIMALFLQEPEDGLKAAIKMIKTLDIYNEERISKGREAVRIGIGMHTGQLMMGMIGDDRRLDTGLVADTVNTTSRIEGLTKFYGSPILISKNLYECLEDPSLYHFRYLGKTLVKGRIEPLDLYECLDGELGQAFEWKMKSQEAFEAGLEAYYNKEFTRAMDAFNQVLSINADDKAATYFRDQARDLQDMKISPDWTGVTRMG